MSKVYLEDSTLTNIADAIRAKAGNSTQLLPSEMPAAITSLPTGGGGGGGGDIPGYYIPIPAANEYSLGKVDSGTPLEYNWIKIPSSASKKELDVTILGFDSAQDFLNRCVYFAFAGNVYYQTSSSKLRYNKIILPWLRNDYSATDASYNTAISDFLSKNAGMLAYGTVSAETYGKASTSYDSNFGPGVQDAADNMPGCIGILHYDGFADGTSGGKSVPYAFEAWALNSSGIITFWRISTAKGAEDQAVQHTKSPFVGNYYVDVISLPRKEN